MVITRNSLTVWRIVLSSDEIDSRQQVVGLLVDLGLCLEDRKCLLNNHVVECGMQNSMQLKYSVSRESVH